MRIVIVMEGGLIQDIFTEAPMANKPEVLVCDFDTEGGMGKELMETPPGDMGYHRMFEVANEPGLVGAWFARWNKHEPERDEPEKEGLE